MQNQTFNIKGGVLIIGSLLWQDHLDKPGDDIRKAWRQEHLLADLKIMVSVPIRYGRQSNDGIYTMTFSKSADKNKRGTGYFIPFSKNPITTPDELFNEAIALSIAEGMRGRFIGNSWGALGILFNDKKISKSLKNNITILWRNKITETREFNNQLYKIKNETACIKTNGLLNFNWVAPIDKRQQELLNSYDFLIATVTRPKQKYPTIKELIENVKADKARNYFIENYKAGITTFQDISVLNNL